MYAVFQVSGFQYRGEEGAIIRIPRQKAAEGEKIHVAEVLLVKNGDSCLVGTPFIDGASLEAEVLRHGRADKVLVYKQKRRTKYRRKQGHRQGFTEIKITSIISP